MSAKAAARQAAFARRRQAHAAAGPGAADLLIGALRPYRGRTLAGYAANQTEHVIGEQAKRVMQRFYAEHNEQARKLFGELAPDEPAAKYPAWLAPGGGGTGGASNSRTRV